MCCFIQLHRHPLRLRVGILITAFELMQNIYMFIFFNCFLRIGAVSGIVANLFLLVFRCFHFYYHYHFDTYPVINFIILLIINVLFLNQTTRNIYTSFSRLKLKRQSFVIIIITGIIIFVFCNLIFKLARTLFNKCNKSGGGQTKFTDRRCQYAAWGAKTGFAYSRYGTVQGQHTQSELKLFSIGYCPHSVMLHCGAKNQRQDETKSSSLR